MLQLLLFSIYAIIMGALISAVVNEPISGVVILIIGVPISGIYLLLAIGVGLASSRSLNDNGPGNFESSGDMEKPFLFGEWNKPILFFTVIYILYNLWLYI